MAVYYRVDPAHDPDCPLPPLVLTAEPDAPPASPGLPEGVWRDRFVEDVIRVHGAALSLAACDVLRYYARLTAPHDWTEPGDGPVCWGRQADAAEALGLSERTVRRAEKSLEALGLIAWDCAANGGRRAPRGDAGAGAGPALRADDPASTPRSVRRSRSAAGTGKTLKPCAAVSRRCGAR